MVVGYSSHFNIECYLLLRADFFEEEASAPALNQSIPWVSDLQGRPKFADDHRHRLTVLATHALPLLPPIPSDVHSLEGMRPQDTRASIYLGLVDMLLAYAYDYRVTGGEHNCESGWTIMKLAATLSWLEVSRHLSFCRIYKVGPLLENLNRLREQKVARNPKPLLAVNLLSIDRS